MDLFGRKRIAELEQANANLNRRLAQWESGSYINLTPHEIQSKHSRVKWAEGLIKQLPETHDGRNSWLLNYGSEAK